MQNGFIALQIKEAVLFKVDQWQLECESKEKLSKLIGFLTYLIRAHSDSRVRITGHTDIIGSDSHDDTLSVNRAREVRNYFVSAGIPVGIVEDAGLGKRQPVGFSEPQSKDVIRRANQTEEQRQKNRRVEILISSATIK
jgi:outer membrane protein OmpA-like peptidoglycan-associated protein